MEKKKHNNIEKAIIALNKAEKDFWRAESNVSKLGIIIQPFFDEEIVVCMSTDGAIITTNNGEIGFVREFLENQIGKNESKEFSK